MKQTKDNTRTSRPSSGARLPHPAHSKAMLKGSTKFPFLKPGNSFSKKRPSEENTAFVAAAPAPDLPSPEPPKTVANVTTPAAITDYYMNTPSKTTLPVAGTPTQDDAMKSPPSGTKATPPNPATPAPAAPAAPAPPAIPRCNPCKLPEHLRSAKVAAPAPEEAAASLLSTALAVCYILLIAAGGVYFGSGGSDARFGLTCDCTARPCYRDVKCASASLDPAAGLGCFAESQPGCRFEVLDCGSESSYMQPCFVDASCEAGMLGCNATGVDSLRFCGFGPYKSIACPGAKPASVSRYGVKRSALWTASA